MKFCVSIIFVVCMAWPVQMLADPLEEAVIALERLQMRWLNQQQNRPGVVIDEFRSDGCSGGMSETWTTMAGVAPGFAALLGEKPPWENCCVAHDRDYWRGESVNGYELRLQSDRELRHCVRQSGVNQAEALSKSLGLSSAEIIESINLIADLMHTAVRVGGAPCTGLPWRWGHGWPECAFTLPPETAGQIRTAQ